MPHRQHLRVDSFAAHALAERGEILRARMLRVRDRPDPGAVHDLRVAIRRLRACLRAFSTVFRARGVRALEKRLRRLFQLSGEVRDLDIALELRREHSQPDPSLKRSRRKRVRVLLEWLKKRRVRKLVRRVRRVARTVKTDARDVRALGADELGRRITELFEQARRAVAEQAGPPELHRLRIAAKKARYAVDVYLPALGPDAEAVALELSSMQTLLGEIQDCAATLRLLPVEEAEARVAIEARQMALRRRFFQLWRERLDAPGALDFLLEQVGAATGSVAAT